MTDRPRSPRLGPTRLGPARDTVPDGLAELSGPLFDARRGGAAARAAKRIANALLAVPTRPQRFFNDALRALLGRWAALLHELMDVQGILAAEIATQRADLARLAAEVAALRGRPSPVLPRVAIGAAAAGCWRVGGAAAPGVDVVADAARLPFRDGALEEIVVAAAGACAADEATLAAWRAALRPDGRLRCTPPLGDPDTLVPGLAAAGFDDIGLAPAPEGGTEPVLVARRALAEPAW